MNDEQRAGAGPTAGDDILARFEDFKRNAELSMTRLTRLQDEISALVQLPDSTAVTATLDEDGRLVGLEIDRAARAELDAEALNHEINLALARASRERPLPDAGEARAEADRAGGIDVGRLIEQVFSAQPDMSAPPEPEVRWNDRRTVGVTVLWGTIQSIACDTAWLAGASEATISDEVIRAAGAAQDEEARRRPDGEG